jgi:GTP-binding protein Era
MAEEGEAFYPEEYYTDQDLNFRIAEIIREKAINRLRQELPHSLYVEVADTELRDDGVSAEKTRLWVRAFIIVERESQKGMVVGKGGEMIKAIRQEAQKDLNRILDWKVELDLRVKSSRDWRHNDRLLRRLISRD